MSKAACKTILNGRISAAILNNLADAVQRESYKEGFVDGPNSGEIIDLLNSIENAANRATRLFLEDVGFTGPWPLSLQEADSAKPSKP